MPGESAAAQLSAAYAPPAGTFQWEPGYPAQLYSFWSQGSANTLDRGAITGFEADHGLPTNGMAGTAVWKALLDRRREGPAEHPRVQLRDRQPAAPGDADHLAQRQEGVLLARQYRDLRLADRAGTFPVYLKLPFQIMSGTNPDGSHYADPVEWVSYFEGGDAVHYFDRGSYGWPQSLGCVELPYTAAKAGLPVPAVRHAGDRQPA